jgi:RNA polymerase sigma factor CnrH
VTDPTAPEPAVTPCTEGLDAILASDRLPRKLHGFIRRRIPQDAPDAEAVYWETLDAFRTFIDRAECPAGEYPKLLFGIADKKVADYWRAERRKRHSVLVEPSDLDLLTQEWVDPYQAVEQRVDLTRAFAEAPLDDAMRQALVLVVVDQLSQDEAAAVMGVHRSRLRRLLTKAYALVQSSGRLDAYGHVAGTSARRSVRRGASEVRP